MEQLIKIEEENGKRAVNARDLHHFLRVRRDFSTWIKERINQYGFVEEQDYQKLCFDYQGNELIIRYDKNGESDNQYVSKIEYALSIDMAKELSMIENNERGRKDRKYFIACEKELERTSKKELPGTYLDALKALVASEEEKLKLQQKNEKLKEDNDYKAKVIEGLVYDIPVADMRQRINQIVLKDGSSDFREKWVMLYEEFERK